MTDSNKNHSFITKHKTIKRNWKKQIDQIINDAVVIDRYRFSDYNDELNTVISKEALRAELDKGYINGISASVDTGSGTYTKVTFEVHSNLWYTAYISKPHAKRQLTEEGYTRMFGTEEEKQILKDAKQTRIDAMYEDNDINYTEVVEGNFKHNNIEMKYLIVECFDKPKNEDAFEIRIYEDLHEALIFSCSAPSLGSAIAQIDQVTENQDTKLNEMVRNSIKTYFDSRANRTEQFNAENIKGITREINNKTLWFDTEERADEFMALWLAASKEAQARRQIKAGDKVELKTGETARVIRTYNGTLKARVNSGYAELSEVKTIFNSLAAQRLNYDLAVRAHYHTSHFPELRGYLHFESFDAMAAKVARHLTNDENRVQAFNTFLDKLTSLYTEYLHKLSNCMSSMITGPSNFPTRKAERANAAEKRAREALDALVNNWTKKATSNVISSDDNDALAKLQAKLQGLKEYQESMKLINKAYKAFKKNPEALSKFDLNDKQIEIIKTFKPAYSFEKAPCQPYTLSTNLANIKRIEQRIKALEIRDAREEANQEKEVTTVEGVVRVSHEDNRVKLFFNGKPSASTRSILKSNGFRFAPSTKAWQRQLTTNGIRSCEYVLGQLAA